MISATFGVFGWEFSVEYLQATPSMRSRRLYSTTNCPLEYKQRKVLNELLNMVDSQLQGN